MSNNDITLNFLSEYLENFLGTANQTWCFVHSILAKLIIQQFDTPKLKNSEIDNKAAEALAVLYEELNVEKRLEREEC